MIYGSLYVDLIQYHYGYYVLRSFIIYFTAGYSYHNYLLRVVFLPILYRHILSGFISSTRIPNLVDISLNNYSNCAYSFFLVFDYGNIFYLHSSCQIVFKCLNIFTKVLSFPFYKSASYLLHNSEKSEIIAIKLKYTREPTNTVGFDNYLLY